MDNLLEEIIGAKKGLTLTLSTNDIVELWINWDPSRAKWGRPNEICKADVHFKKNNIKSEVTLYARTLPEILSKLQDFVLSL